MKTTLLSLLSISGLLFTNLCFADPAKKATSIYADDTHQTNPTIVITGRIIIVSLHQIHGSISGSRGVIDGVELRGTGGVYDFSENGRYKIEPGTYTIFVKGTIYGGGKIEATIKYD